MSRQPRFEITEPYASDDDADRNADRDHAMGQRQHAEAGR